MTLGVTAPWSDCPTRIIKKTGDNWQRQQYKKGKKVEGNITIHRLAVLNKIRPQNLRCQAIKFFERYYFPDGLTKDQADKLIKFYKEGGYK